MDQKITDMYELLDFIEVIIEAADPAKRKALAQTIDAFAENFPEDFFLGCRPAGADAPAPFAVKRGRAKGHARRSHRRAQQGDPRNY